METTAIAGGSTITLTVQADEGLGMAPLHRLSERGPMQHGASDRGFRLDPRIFSLLVVVHGDDRTGLYEQRDALLTFLPPTASVALRFTRDDGVQRQIDCTVIDMPMPYDARRELAAQTVAIRFLATDPAFYDPAGRSVPFGLAGGSDSGEVPTAIPMAVGASTLDQTSTISYAGNFRSLPWRIRIAGPITDPVVTNETTDEKLDFTGVTIGSADYYDIDCRYGYKTVVDSSGVNKIADLTDDSDLATWHLQPGNNSVKVSGSAVTESTEVYIAFYERYLGI